MHQLPEGCLFLDGENAVSSFLFLTIPGLFDLVVTTNEVGSICYTSDRM